MRPRTSHPNPKLRHWNPGVGVQQSSLWYRSIRCTLHVMMCALWKVRVFNRHYEPADGGVLYISNHQSFLDPILMSFALRRPMNYMARDSLFHFPVFKQLIRSVNAFPVRRGTADLTALKEAMRRIRDNGQVVVFAEGTRSTDGRIGSFLPGVAILAQRAAQWTVPVLIDGAFEAWPRTQAIPSPGSVVVEYAPPIPREEASRLSPQEFVDRVRATLIDMQTDLRRRLGRTTLHYD